MKITYQWILLDFNKDLHFLADAVFYEKGGPQKKKLESHSVVIW